MKRAFLVITLLLFFSSVTLSQTAFDSLQKYERQLKALADTITDGWNEFSRLDAVTDYIPLLVKALKVQGSFNYPFDSLRFMHKLYDPENTFRLLNWAMRFDDGTYRYYGAIQFSNTKRKIIPLYDLSNKIPYDAVEDTLLDSESWFGCLYFKMIKARFKGKDYYVLLGWDGNNKRSQKKIIEIMYFENENVLFGAPLIYDGKGRIRYRRVFEYNSTAIFILKYVPEKKLISFDHLVPAKAKDAGKPWANIPDGTYDCYLIKKKGLVFKANLFDDVRMPKSTDRTF